MWVTYFFVSYLGVAFAIPLCLSLVPLWRRANQARSVPCPGASQIATVRLDSWYAVRMHALGNRELRVKDCSQWPQRCACGQACLERIGAGNPR